MSNGTSGKTGELVGKCGSHPRSTSDSCGQPQGWGLSGDSGPCKHHVKDASGANADNTNMSEKSQDGDGVEQACKTLAEALGESVSEYGEKASLSGSNADIVATALIRKTGAGADGYTAVFGECEASDCERGCNGFGADTCDQHESEDTGEKSQDGDTMTVEIDGREVTGKREDIEQLLGK